jgi:hypothetical protein
MRRICALALGGLLLSAAWGSVAAQPALPPAAQEPKAEFALTPKHGPCMVYIASFRGEEAWDLAHSLAQELRDNYKLPAFVHRRVDQDAEAERRRLLELQAQRQGDEFASPYRRTVRVQEEYAVLVGHFTDLKAAAEAAKKFKTLQPPKSTGNSGVAYWKRNQPDQEVKQDRVFTEMMPFSRSRKYDKALEPQRNPFQQAFPTRNPMASLNQGRKEGSNPYQDDSWMEINKREDYSLFTCQQPYTLVVKEFRSKETKQFSDQKNNQASFLDRFRSAEKKGIDLKPDQMDPFNQEKLKYMKKRGFTFLPTAMDQAEEALAFAKELRKAKFQAYVLHFGESSLVTVGGFTGLRDPALKQTGMALKSQFGKELPMLQNTLPTLMPVPGRDAPKLGEPVK